MTDRRLIEAQRVERAIVRVRWGAAAVTLLLGPFFPSLSLAAVFALGLGILGYNAAAMRASAAAREASAHVRVERATFAADLVAVCAAMFIFSADPDWTTYLVVPLAILASAFRLDSRYASVAAVVTGTAYVATAAFRAAAFGYGVTPQRVAFTLSMFALMTLLVDRVMRDGRQLRVERETLIRGLHRRIEEDAALAQAARVVATVAAPGEVVPALLRSARSVLRFDRATVFGPDEQSGEYLPQYRVVADGVAAAPAPRIPVGEGLIAAALAADRPLLIPDLLQDPRYWPASDAERPRSVILIPLRVAGRAASVFALSRALPDPFSTDDLRIADQVAALVAQVLENHRLFAEASEAQALRELDAMKDEFLTSVSHELRTPLTVVSGAVELLGRMDGLPPRAATLVGQASKHVARLQRDVEALLEIAQLQEARVMLDREPVDPAALLAEVVEDHAPLAASRSQSVRIAGAEGVQGAELDRRWMTLALGNLLSNAIRYAPEGTEILLAAEDADGELRLSVRDHGPGIPGPERERVFDRFYRLRRDTHVAGGTGLGLAIARSVTALHQGRIWVESPADGGARFVIAVRR